MKFFNWNKSVLILITVLNCCNFYHSLAQNAEPTTDSIRDDDNLGVTEAHEVRAEDEGAPVTPPPVVEDENTKIARDLYKAASAMLNSSSPDRHMAWVTMERSADLGNVDAKIRIAFAKLAGVFFEQVSTRHLMMQSTIINI